MNFVIRGLYRDSVQLMEVTERVKRLEGVLDAAVVMGTAANKESLVPMGLLTSEGEKAGPNDIIIALKATANVEQLLEQVKKIIFEIKTTTARFANIDDAMKMHPDIRYASISIPGKYVEEVALNLLQHGVNLFIFSDHVPIETEVLLKKQAASRDLLVMGPEAGTAIVSGIGFGFANKVASGNIGVVASAGSGIQEFVTLLDRYDMGISHAIGVGARDLSRDVGGIMTRKALQTLNNDEKTKIIALIAKQSDIAVVREILEEEKLSKPLVLSLLGYEEKVSDYPQSPTLHGLFLHAAHALSKTMYEKAFGALKKEVERLKTLVIRRDGYPRAFYSGGTLATETAYLWAKAGLKVYTNLNFPRAEKIDNPYTSVQATVIDYGSEEFTEGRPHPIIDPTLRNKRIISELNSNEASCIAMDLIIGYGAPDNIIAKIFDEIGDAIVKNRDKRFVIRLVGTNKDHQWGQTNLLDKFGVVTTASNALAAMFSAACGLGEPAVLEKLAEELSVEVKI
ncbi:MAG: hypothetical protein NZ581_01015 [Candidatus Caldarchaeum sp.]|nr:hypothetical protein [Candidatus Caldarchaeum sp.]MDW8434769.1 hypothetical protein [Candidatus Caldarchaeum sp.]